MNLSDAVPDMKRTTDGSKTHQSEQKMENALEQSAGLNWNIRFCSSLYSALGGVGTKERQIYTWVYLRRWLVKSTKVEVEQA